jgi:hypothetical protein
MVAAFASYRWVFLLAVVPAGIGFFIACKLVEPNFRHNSEPIGHETVDAGARAAAKKENSIGAVLSRIWNNHLLLALWAVMLLLWVVWSFGEGFGQIFFLSLVPAGSEILTPQTLATIAFGVFYGAWAIAEMQSDKFSGKYTVLIVFSTVPLVFMCAAPLVLSGWAAAIVTYGAFLVLTCACAILMRQVKAEIHAVTPSLVRDTVMSIVATTGRLMSAVSLIPIGLVMQKQGMLSAVWLVAAVGIATLVIWIGFMLYRGRAKASAPAVVLVPEEG